MSTQMMKFNKSIASLGGIGNLPASGTWGSLIALPFAWFLIGSMWIPVICTIFFLLGILTINPLIQNQDEKDPSYVVIDEFMGQLLVFSFIDKAIVSPITLVFGFFFFRLFDIFKPWPASYFDQEVHTGFGVMMDDLIAALYSIICLAFMEVISYYL